MELTPTPEEITKHITNAYDSVNLINQLKAITLPTTEDTNGLARNKEHLIIMLEKPWFTGGCTAAQITELTAAAI